VHNRDELSILNWFDPTMFVNSSVTLFPADDVGPDKSNELSPRTTVNCWVTGAAARNSSFPSCVACSWQLPMPLTTAVFPDTWHGPPRTAYCTGRPDDAVACNATDRFTAYLTWPPPGDGKLMVCDCGGVVVVVVEGAGVVVVVAVLVVAWMVVAVEDELVEGRLVDPPVALGSSEDLGEVRRVVAGPDPAD
jgi:hypothetical protein